MDGIAILHLQGKALAVQIEEGAPVITAVPFFRSAAANPAAGALGGAAGPRGYVHIVDQPNIDNHYTLAVAIEDRQPGSAFYSIGLYWDASNSRFESRGPKTDHVTWQGDVWIEMPSSVARGRVVFRAIRGRARSR